MTQPLPADTSDTTATPTPPNTPPATTPGTPPALDHPELQPTPPLDQASALALVERAGVGYRDGRTHLDDTIRAAVAAGVSEAEVTRASGLAKMTVRKILGKLDGPAKTAPKRDE